MPTPITFKHPVDASIDALPMLGLGQHEERSCLKAAPPERNRLDAQLFFQSLSGLPYLLIDRFAHVRVVIDYHALAAVPECLSFI